MTWFEVAKIWIFNFFTMIWHFLTGKKEEATISKEEHIESVLHDVGYYKEKDYQIIFRKEIESYWVGSNKKNPEGLPMHVTEDLKEAIAKLEEFENSE